MYIFYKFLKLIQAITEPAGKQAVSSPRPIRFQGRFSHFIPSHKPCVACMEVGSLLVLTQKYGTHTGSIKVSNTLFNA